MAFQVAERDEGIKYDNNLIPRGTAMRSGRGYRKKQGRQAGPDEFALYPLCN